MKHWLTISDDAWPRCVELKNPQYTVGYGGGKKVDVKVYAHVAPRHLAINHIGDEWEVEDLGSSRGTFVNNERVTRKILKKGDIITFGFDGQLFFDDDPWVSPGDDSPQTSPVPKEPIPPTDDLEIG
jgi:pSer/pThr/pTyr-binding forkhead associated (FHA) protein